MSDEDTHHPSGRSIKARPPTTVASASGVAGPSAPSTSTPLPERASVFVGWPTSPTMTTTRTDRQTLDTDMDNPNPPNSQAETRNATSETRHPTLVPCVLDSHTNRPDLGARDDRPTCDVDLSREHTVDSMRSADFAIQHVECDVTLSPCQSLSVGDTDVEVTVPVADAQTAVVTRSQRESPVASDVCDMSAIAANISDHSHCDSSHVVGLLLDVCSLTSDANFIPFSQRCSAFQRLLLVGSGSTQSTLTLRH